MSNIYNNLSDFFEKKLSDVAKNYDYANSNIYILEDNFKALKIEYPDIWQALQSCNHQRDKRTIEEYAKDLVSSWVYEDTVLNYLKNDFDIELYGADRERRVLSNSKVSSDNDFIIKKNGELLNIELVNSYTNYWKKYQRIDLRDNKFEKLKSKQAILICVDICNKEFYLIDLKKINKNIKYIGHHKPYGKPAYQIFLNDITVHSFSIENLIVQLNKLLNEKI
ncbi:hypothetical protein [Bathymodiolus thermophilus thioautotrophic gill symbiont]|uniref:Uncharacterized protein n=1 Tax=Bathymodiolus thermophilus thioautotrophic gill symbiont TaxID=2360 RepID=A0A1J5TW82_9GAMM|nr:hypothetical protein [Bathymodiolus thermophilus thioautotrophic gill symbiont]OIR25104.1 hypothetical protein BGC33_05565 [Bathymodiolus thermophilus thioautotrophic gill symbiont]